MSILISKKRTRCLPFSCNLAFPNTDRGRLSVRHFTGSSLTGHGLILFGLRVGPCLTDFNEINLFPAKSVFKQFMWR